MGLGQSVSSLLTGEPVSDSIPNESPEPSGHQSSPPTPALSTNNVVDTSSDSIVVPAHLIFADTA
jgi:hypothetical protein